MARTAAAAMDRIGLTRGNGMVRGDSGTAAVRPAVAVLAGLR
jgi:hypothetical protein